MGVRPKRADKMNKAKDKRTITALPGKADDGSFSELETFEEEWLQLTPRERLRRSWKMRSRIRNPALVHDAKLFPRP